MFDFDHIMMKAAAKRISNIERENTEIRVPFTLHQSLMRNDTVSVLKRKDLLS